MAINLFKLEDDLKNAPDQALVGYVQNPTGHVPTYLALAELERRKRMRESTAGAQAAQANQPTVADQLTAQAQPQMAGVASLPVENVGSEEAYAAGGIVAFEDGGEVKKYALGDYVISDEEYAKLSPVEKVQYDRNRAAVAGYTTMKPFAAAADLVGGPLNMGYQSLESLGNLVPRAAKAIGVMDPNSDYRLRLPRIGSGTATPYTDMIRQAEAQRFGTTSEAPIVMTPEQPNAQQQYANAEAAKLRQRINAGEFTQAQRDDVTASNQAQRDDVNAPPRGPGITGLTEIPQWENIDASKYLYDTKPFENAVGPEPTMGGVAALNQAQRAERGISEDPYAPLMKDIETEKGVLTKQFQQDTWMRLAEFGATLASTPGSSGAAIGEAGKKVIPSVIADKKEMKKVERELNKEVKQMALAREGMLEARMKGDYERLDKDTEKYERSKDRLTQITLKNADVARDIGIKNIEKSFDVKMEKYKQEEQTKRTSMQVAAQDRATSETRKQTVARNMLESAMKPILAGLKAQMVDDDTAYAQAFDQALRKLPKEMQEVLGYTPQETEKAPTLRFDAKGNPIK